MWALALGAGPRAAFGHTWCHPPGCGLAGLWVERDQLPLSDYVGIVSTGSGTGQSSSSPGPGAAGGPSTSFLLGGRWALSTSFLLERIGCRVLRQFKAEELQEEGIDFLQV